MNDPLNLIEMTRVESAIDFCEKSGNAISVHLDPRTARRLFEMAQASLERDEARERFEQECDNLRQELAACQVELERAEAVAFAKEATKGMP